MAINEISTEISVGFYSDSEVTKRRADRIVQYLNYDIKSRGLHCVFHDSDCELQGKYDGEYQYIYYAYFSHIPDYNTKVAVGEMLDDALTSFGYDTYDVYYEDFDDNGRYDG